MLAVLAAAVPLTGCAAEVVPGRAGPVRLDEAGRQLLAGYFDEINQAGDQGAGQQHAAFRRRQHPDYQNQLCDLGDLTLRLEPTLSTLRPDAGWTPPDSAGRPSGERPRGAVYVVAVTVTVRREGVPVGSQIGSQRLVLLDGTAYGFAPCLSG